MQKSISPLQNLLVPLVFSGEKLGNRTICKKRLRKKINPINSKTEPFLTVFTEMIFIKKTEIS